MSATFLGYFYAVMASIFFGIYIIPRKLTKQHSVHYTFFVGLGFFLSSLVAYGIHYILSSNPESFHNKALIYAALEGVLWGAGFLAFTASIVRIGLSRSNQWKNLQGPVGVILSLIILSEFLQANALFAVLAGLAIFGSALFFNIRHDDGKKVDLTGITLAFISAIFFGTVTVINKYVTTNSGVYAQQVVWSLFVFISMAVYILFNKELRTSLIKVEKRDKLLGILGGVLYLGASFFMLQSYRFVPASIAFTIIQLNAVWVIAIGILVFKEIDYKKNSGRILGGLLFAIAGIVLLLFARK